MSGDGGDLGRRFKRQLVLFVSIALQFTHGWSDNPSDSKDGTKTEAPKSSKTTGSVLLLICLLVVAIVGLSFLLFKLWQKKKREEQHARLLRLFEEDDELEVELGLRD